MSNIVAYCGLIIKEQGSNHENSSGLGNNTNLLHIKSYPHKILKELKGVK